jgi:hypothetical protein
MPICFVAFVTALLTYLNVVADSSAFLKTPINGQATIGIRDIFERGLYFSINELVDG